MRKLFFTFFFFAVAASAGTIQATPSPFAPPKISDLLKASVYERVLKNREIMTHATLDDAQPPHAAGMKEYHLYSAMLVHASLTKSHRILVDYSLYSQLIPYVSISKFDAKTQRLEIQGGIFGWVLHSWIHFEDRSPRWIHFEIVAGHFQGMTGDIYFEPEGENGTLIYLGSSQTLSHWPPKFILEAGAEIVFGFTANRMRSYIESPTQSEGQENGGIPQPRSHL
jgi:hypothetical protein